MWAFHEYRLDKLERFALEKDVIISGIPLEQNDNPLRIIGEICHALNCNLNERDFATVYRLRTRNSSSRPQRTVPIIARLYDNWSKQELFSGYFKKKDLNLKDIGFQTSARIFINENLTQSNRAIFKLASEAKKANLIFKFHSRNGSVHVQRNESSKIMCMYHISDLKHILPPSFDRASSFASNTMRSGMNGRATFNDQQSHKKASLTNTTADNKSQEEIITNEKITAIDPIAVPNSNLMNDKSANSNGNIQMDHETSTVAPHSS